MSALICVRRHNITLLAGKKDNKNVKKGMAVKWALIQ
jgi:hypothetical protein